MFTKKKVINHFKFYGFRKDQSINCRGRLNNTLEKFIKKNESIIFNNYMDSFFFIPATKIANIENINKQHVDHIIIDFEDAIKESERNVLVESIESQPDIAKDSFIRVPLYDNTQVNLDLKVLKIFINKGFDKFVFPKLETLEDLEKIYHEIKGSKIRIILLIETPQLYFELQTNINKYKNHFYALALGSHDFMSVVGGKHNLNNLESLRQNILYLSRAYYSLAIDIASMNISSPKEFVIEVQDGFNKGYDAKFIIHPKQLSNFNTIEFYDKKEYNFSLKIISKLSKVGFDEFSPFVIEDKIIERPHINYAKKVLTYYNKKHGSI